MRFWSNFSKQFLLIATLLLLLICGVFMRMIFHTVYFGEAAVLFRRFTGGTVMNRVLGEGFKIIPPWDILYIYDVKIQERQMDVDVLMTNGLTMHVAVSVRYKPIEKDLGMLHKTIGPMYEKKIVMPVVAASVREVLGKFLPEELYSQKCEVLQALAEERCRVSVADKFIHIDRLIIRSITMPKLINDSIEAKLQQQQKYQEYVFRIQKEKQEAERKRIEAEGIETYHKILVRGLSPAILEYETIQMKALLALSGSARTIIMDLNTQADGSSMASPPVILNLPDEKVQDKPASPQDKESRSYLPQSDVLKKLRQEGIVSPTDKVGGSDDRQRR